MRLEVENRLAQTYRRLSLISAIVMLIGWLWHLWRHDAQNGLILVGVGLLLLTPLLALMHLAWLVAGADRPTARYSLLTIGLVGLALLIGLLTGGGR